MRPDVARLVKRIAHRNGEPVQFNAMTAHQIVTRRAEGETLKGICDSRFMPHPSTVHNWLEAHPEFAKAYERATRIGHDMQADECVEIADEVEDKDGVPQAKLRISTRLDILERRDARYSKRQNVTHSGSLSLAALIDESYQAPAIEGQARVVEDNE